MYGLVNEYIAMNLAKARQNELINEAKQERVAQIGLAHLRLLNRQRKQETQETRQER